MHIYSFTYIYHTYIKILKVAYKHMHRNLQRRSRGFQASLKWEAVADQDPLSDGQKERLYHMPKVLHQFPVESPYDSYRAGVRWKNEAQRDQVTRPHQTAHGCGFLLATPG